MKSVKSLNRILWASEYWFKALKCQIWLTNTKSFFWKSEAKVETLQKPSPYFWFCYKFVLKSEEHLRWLFYCFFECFECGIFNCQISNWRKCNWKRTEFCLMTLRSDAKFEEKLICCFKNDKNLVNFDLSTQFSKICTVICPFCAKYITFDQKKYRGVIFNDTEESCKIWRKTGLWFGKWHKEFGKFSSEHLKVSKLVLSWDHFVQSRKCMS